LASQQLKLIFGHIQRGLAGLVRIGHPGSQDIDHSVDDAAVTGVFDLLDVLDLIIDGCDDRALAQQQLIDQGHEFVVHILTDLGD
jgi:hypothetical protein